MKFYSIVMASMSLFVLSQTAQAGWLPLKCINTCTADNCKDEKRREDCQANCQNTPSVLQECLQDSKDKAIADKRSALPPSSQQASAAGKKQPKPLPPLPTVPARASSPAVRPPAKPLPTPPQRSEHVDNLGLALTEASHGAKVAKALSGFVSKERCAQCGTPKCGTDMKLLGDCKVCGSTNEQFEECLKYFNAAGFNKLKSESVQKSMAQGESDSWAISKQKIEKLLMVSRALDPLVKMTKPKELGALKKKTKPMEKYKNLQADFDHLSASLTQENNKLQTSKVPTSNEKLSGLKTGLFGVRALACQQIIDDFKTKRDKRIKAEKKALKKIIGFVHKSKTKKLDVDNVNSSISTLESLCKAGSSLATGDINQKLPDIINNLSEMKNVTSVLKEYFTRVK